MSGPVALGTAPTFRQFSRKPMSIPRGERGEPGGRMLEQPRLEPMIRMGEDKQLPVPSPGSEPSSASRAGSSYTSPRGLNRPKRRALEHAGDDQRQDHRGALAPKDRNERVTLRGIEPRATRGCLSRWRDHRSGDVVGILGPRIASAKMLPNGVVASREMLPAMVRATMPPLQDWRGYGHQR
jgi:hypothetical protein